MLRKGFDTAFTVSDRFDASQYAFFGSEVAEGFEIGGLDDEEDSDRQEQRQDATESLCSGRTMFSPEKEYARDKDNTEAALRAANNQELTDPITKLFVDSPASRIGELVSQRTSETRPDSVNDEAVGGSPTYNCPKRASGEENETLSRCGEKIHQQTSNGEECGLLGLHSQHGHQQNQEYRGQNLGCDADGLPLGAVTSRPKAHSSPYAGIVRSQTARSFSAHALAGQVAEQSSSIQSQMGTMSPGAGASYDSSSSFRYSSSPSTFSLPSWISHIKGPILPTKGSVSSQPFQKTALLPSQVVLHCEHLSGPLFHAFLPSSFLKLSKSKSNHQSVLPSAQFSVMIDESSTIGNDSGDPFSRDPAHGPRHGLHGPAGALNLTPNIPNCKEPFRSKYMSAEEIDNIVRIQWTATHSSDPYIDDYYHQAVQAKHVAALSSASHHFAPSHLRDLPSHTRANIEPHAYLQVNALGRVPFSSIHRPRPLLEVHLEDESRLQIRAGASNDENVTRATREHRPLDQEPMLAARIAIEDASCLLLDVDDIDRLMSVSEALNGGAELRRRRHVLLKGLAVLLKLVQIRGFDENGHVFPGCLVGELCKSDVLFLRVLSLPKGRKLLNHYLSLLSPGSELLYVVGVAVFRHLPFLFGDVLSDPSCLAVTTDLANAVAASVSSMDLPTLSACLAEVVSVPDQPPLRLMGSPDGDLATSILRVVLLRATCLLSDRDAGYPMQVRAIWQASFDAFFNLVADYCTEKYDFIFQSLMMSSSPESSSAVRSAAAVQMNREIPLELLRASLPHTNDQQRNRLLELAERSMGKGIFSSHNDGTAKPASVHM